MLALVGLLIIVVTLYRENVVTKFFPHYLDSYRKSRLFYYGSMFLGLVIGFSLFDHSLALGVPGIVTFFSIIFDEASALYKA